MGIGKSRLWREWLAGVTLECTALEARCVEAASSLPFAPLVELFGSHPCIQDLFHPPSAAEASPVLPLAWLAEVSRLLPELRAQLPELPAPAVLPPEEERRRVFEAFVQALLALDAHPLLIFVDDVHWADHATLDWLPYLVHRMRGRPLLLVLAYRPEEAPAGLVQQVAAWGREGVLRRIPLARLAPEETAALIAKSERRFGRSRIGSRPRAPATPTSSSSSAAASRPAAAKAFRPRWPISSPPASTG